MTETFSHNPSELTLFLVRHGQTTANLAGVIQGHDDSPLTPTGERSCVVKAAKLSDYPISATYCSDLLRARKTLDRMMECSASIKEPVYTQALREIDFGEHTGAVKSDIVEIIKKHKADISLRYPGGESGAELKARVTGFVAEILNTRSKEHVLVVTHYGVIETAVKLYTDFPSTDPFSLEEESVVIISFIDKTTASLKVI